MAAKSSDNVGKRAAIGARVSTKEQKEFGTSLESQVEAGLAHAAELGLQVVPEHVIAEDHTGTEMERPAILAFLEAAANNEIDFIIYPSLDRWYRPKNEGDEWRAFEMIDRFKNLCVEVVFVDPTTPSTGPMAYMKTHWAC